MRVLLFISIGLSVAAIFISILELLVPSLSDPESEEPMVIVFLLAMVGLGLAQVGVFIATVVVFLMWLYRSYENLPSFGHWKSNIQYTSGWAVGSFLIPFVNLVVPYRAVRELWRKSVPNATDMFGSLSPPVFFPFWWAAWLISNVANNIYTRLVWQDRLDVQSDAILGLIVSTIDIISAVFAAMVVQEIDQQQTERAKLIAPQPLSVQPPSPPSFNETRLPDNAY